MRKFALLGAILAMPIALAACDEGSTVDYNEGNYAENTVDNNVSHDVEVNGKSDRR